MLWAHCLSLQRKLLLRKLPPDRAAVMDQKVANTKRVTGVVRDAKGEVLVGALVRDVKIHASATFNPMTRCFHPQWSA